MPYIRLGYYLALTRKEGQVWWHMHVIPELQGLRQEDLNFKTSLGYIVRPCVKKAKTKKKGILIYVTTWMKPEDITITLSELN
jgi:hypothetical protein